MILQTGIVNSVIVLQPFTLNKNGFELLIQDIYGTPVNNASVYTYRSKSVFLADSTYQDTTSVLKSDNNGKVNKYNIDQGWYYFRVKKQIDSTATLSGVDSVNVSANSIVNNTVFVK